MRNWRKDLEVEGKKSQFGLIEKNLKIKGLAFTGQERERVCVCVICLEVKYEKIKEQKGSNGLKNGSNKESAKKLEL